MSGHLSRTSRYARTSLGSKRERRRLETYGISYSRVRQRSTSPVCLWIVDAREVTLTAMLFGDEKSHARYE